LDENNHSFEQSAARPTNVSLDPLSQYSHSMSDQSKGHDIMVRRRSTIPHVSSNRESNDIVSVASDSMTYRSNAPLPSRQGLDKNNHSFEQSAARPTNVSLDPLSQYSHSMSDQSKGHDIMVRRRSTIPHVSSNRESNGIVSVASDSTTYRSNAPLPSRQGLDENNHSFEQSAARPTNVSLDPLSQYSHSMSDQSKGHDGMEPIQDQQYQIRAHRNHLVSHPTVNGRRVSASGNHLRKSQGASNKTLNIATRPRITMGINVANDDVSACNFSNGHSITSDSRESKSSNPHGRIAMSTKDDSDDITECTFLHGHSITSNPKKSKVPIKTNRYKTKIEKDGYSETKSTRASKCVPTPSRKSLMKMSVSMENWLEHCREPLAIKQIVKMKQAKRPQISKEDYAQYNRNLNDITDREYKQLAMETNIVHKSKSLRVNGNKHDFECASSMAKTSRLMVSMKEDYRRQCNRLNGKPVHMKRDIKFDLTTSEKHLPEVILRFVSLLPGNDRCCDCAGPFRNVSSLWASVSYGILLCEQCAFVHINNCEKTKFDEMLKPITNGNWNYPSIIAMVEGSNRNIIKYMKKHDRSFKALHKKTPKRRHSLIVSIVKDNKRAEEDAFSTLYNSKAAISYRKSLLQRISDVLHHS